MMFRVKICHCSLNLCSNLFSWLKGILVYISRLEELSDCLAHKRTLYITKGVQTNRAWIVKCTSYFTIGKKTDFYQQISYISNYKPKYPQGSGKQCK